MSTPAVIQDPYAAYGGKSLGTPVDPYAAYGGKTVGTPVDPYAAYGGSVTPAAKTDDRSWWQKAEDNFNANTQGAKPGDGAIKSFVENVGAGGGDAIRGAANMVQHPIDSVVNMAKSLRPDMSTPTGIVEAALGPGTKMIVDTAKSLYNEPGRTLGNLGVSTLLGEGIGRAVPLVQGAVSSVGGRAAEAVGKMVAGDVNAPIMGQGEMTPAARYAAAQRVGVQLNAADATNSPVLQGLRQWNEPSPFAAGSYDKLKAANLSAMGDGAKNLTDGYSAVDPTTAGTKLAAELKQPFLDMQDRADGLVNSHSTLTPEQGGSRLQELTNDRVSQLQAQKQALYKQVGDDWGDQPVANPKTVVDTAKNISLDKLRADMQNPSLSSPKLNKVLSEARDLGSDGQMEALGPPTVNDLIRTRSGLLDLTRDPDIIKSSHANNIDKLMTSYDQAIVDSLPKEGQAAWRQANSIHADIKNTFDNPSDPMYNAVRTSTPSTLTQGIGGTSPEALARLQATVGPEGLGIVRRGVLEKLLGKTEDGQYDLDNFGTKLQRMPLGSRMQLFGLDGNASLEKLASDYTDAAPYKKAAFDTDPEKLVQGVGGRTGSAFDDLASRISPESVGAMQRGEVEKLLGTDRYGQPNFQTLGRAIEKVPDDYAGALFGRGSSGMATLRDLGTTANTLDFRPNPSGTAAALHKLKDVGMMAAAPGEAIALGATGHPWLAAGALAGNAGYAGLQFTLGRLMNSPEFVDWLMKQQTPVEAARAASPGPTRSLSSVGGVGAISAATARKRSDQP